MRKKLSPQDVHHIASLAHLTLTEKEAKSYAEELSPILTYVDQLKEARAGKESSTSHPGGLTNRFRKDEPRPSLPQVEAIASASRTKNGFIVVRGVFEEE